MDVISACGNLKLLVDIIETSYQLLHRCTSSRHFLPVTCMFNNSTFVYVMTNPLRTFLSEKGHFFKTAFPSPLGILSLHPLISNGKCKHNALWEIQWAMLMKGHHLRVDTPFLVFSCLPHVCSFACRLSESHFVTCSLYVLSIIPVP